MKGIRKKKSTILDLCIIRRLFMLAKRLIVIRTTTISRLIYFRRNGRREPGSIKVINCKECKTRILCTENDISSL